MLDQQQLGGQELKYCKDGLKNGCNQHCKSLQYSLQDDQLKELQRVPKKGFETNEGPFVQALDTALASFNVYRQALYSGTFIGNHVHRAPKVSHIHK